MRNEVRQSLAQSTTSSELRTNLAQRGIELIVNRDKAGQARGLSFERVSQDENGEAVRIAFKGSKLHQTLSLGHIQQELGLNAQKRALELSQQQQLAKAHELTITPQNEEKQLKKGRGLSM